MICFSNWTRYRLHYCLLFIVALALLLTPPVFAADEDVVHVVAPGETLGVIAQRYGVTVEALATANQIADPNRISVGQHLLISHGLQFAGMHEVAVHESITDVARLYRVSLPELSELNRLRDPILVPGQLLRLPPRRMATGPVLPPGPVLEVAVRPTVVSQGRTALITAETRPLVELYLEFEARSYAFHGGPTRWWVLLPISALATPGQYRVSLRSSEGEQPFNLSVVSGGYTTQNIVLSPEVSRLLDPAVMRAEAEKVNAVWAIYTPEPLWEGRFMRPIGEQWPTSSPFGTRRSFNHGPVSGFHAGHDFAAPEGTPVTSPARGRVVLAEELTVRGNAIILDHGLGLLSGYWHLSKIEVEKGQWVEPGERLGLVGNTGLSTGAHLHWELRLHSVAIDPMQWTEETFP